MLNIPIVSIIGEKVRTLKIKCKDSSINVKELLNLLKLNEDYDYVVISDGKVLKDNDPICDREKIAIALIAHGG